MIIDQTIGWRHYRPSGGKQWKGKIEKQKLFSGALVASRKTCAQAAVHLAPNVWLCTDWQIRRNVFNVFLNCCPAQRLSGRARSVHFTRTRGSFRLAGCFQTFGYNLQKGKKAGWCSVAIITIISRGRFGDADYSAFHSNQFGCGGVVGLNTRKQSQLIQRNKTIDRYRHRRHWHLYFIRFECVYRQFQHSGKLLFTVSLTNKQFQAPFSFSLFCFFSLMHTLSLSLYAEIGLLIDTGWRRESIALDDQKRWTVGMIAMTAKKTTHKTNEQ